MLKETAPVKWFDGHKTVFQQTCFSKLTNLEADLAQVLCEALSGNPLTLEETGLNLSAQNAAATLNSLRSVLATLRRFVVSTWVAGSSVNAHDGLALVDLLDHVEETADRLWSGLETALVEATARCHRFETVAQIGRNLIGSYDLEHSLQVAIGVADVLQVDKAAFMILDHESDHFFTWSHRDLKLPPLALDVLPDEWRRGWGACITLPDDEAGQAWLEQLLGEERLPTVAAIPLNAGGSLYGLLLLLRRDASRQPFDEEELNLASTIASQAASLVSNAEVYRLINTQATQLGEMLREQQNEASKNRAILRSIADGVTVNDPQGKIILINPAAERIVGVHKSDIARFDMRTLLEMFKTSGRDDALAALDHILANPEDEESAGLTATLALEQGMVSARMAPVITPQDEFLGVVTILRDITKEVEADRAKSEFVSNVSHELRTPMTAIKGYTDLLYAGAVGPVNDMQARFLGIIKSNTERLTALINDLLDISRIETGRMRFEPGPLHLGDVVVDVIEAMTARAQERSHSLTYTIATEVPEIHGDRDRLVQVLTNLVGNAINYTPEGGTIDVQVSTTDGAVQVDVTDTGVGIPAEDLSKVFDRFYRGEHSLIQQSAGTGLGLSIVKMFVEMHGGRMWVQSEMGQGSTFTFILPISDPPTPESKLFMRPTSDLRTVR